MKRVFLSSALVLPIAALLIGCGKAEPDGHMTNTFVFNNKTNSTVMLEAYEGSELRHYWVIEPGKSLSQTVAAEEYRGYASALSSNADLYTHASVFDYPTARLLIGGTHDLWFRDSDLATPYNIYNPNNYKFLSINDNDMTWTYDIDRRVVAAANPLSTPGESDFSDVYASVFADEWNYSVAGSSENAYVDYMFADIEIPRLTSGLIGESTFTVGLRRDFDGASAMWGELPMDVSKNGLNYRISHEVSDGNLRIICRFADDRQPTLMDAMGPLEFPFGKILYFHLHVTK